MKLLRTLSCLCAATAAILLASCGGGGDSVADNACL